MEKNKLEVDVDCMQAKVSFTDYVTFEQRPKGAEEAAMWLSGEGGENILDTETARPKSLSEDFLSYLRPQHLVLCLELSDLCFHLLVYI